MEKVNSIDFVNMYDPEVGSAMAEEQARQKEPSDRFQLENLKILTEESDDAYVWHFYDLVGVRLVEFACYCCCDKDSCGGNETDGSGSETPGSFCGKSHVCEHAYNCGRCGHCCHGSEHVK